MYDLSFLKHRLEQLFPSDIDDVMFLQYLIELDKLDDNGSKEVSEKSLFHSGHSGNC